jgi:hypothetical protein
MRLEVEERVEKKERPKEQRNPMKTKEETNTGV